MVDWRAPQPLPHFAGARSKTFDGRSRGWTVAALGLVLVIGWAFTHRLGSFPLLDDPNEAQYAEVAREMLETGDWLSPQLNYVLFLNKPPLSYWAIASVFQIWGIHEAAARLPSAAAGWLTVVVALVWGWRAFGPPVGCLAAALLASMGGFFVETHEVRPDLWLVLGITVSLFALWEIWQRPEERLERGSGWLALWQVGLAVGLLAKGMLALLVPAAVTLVLLACERQWRRALCFFHPRAWWLWLALVGPWHAAMSFVHAGFLWDYVINQHLLFFFDKKFPRDSTPISLPMFWAAFAMRVFPWSVFVPLSVAAGVAALRRQTEERTALVILLAWPAIVLALFSAASSRLEHYSLPALPPLALLLAVHLVRANELSRRWITATWIHWVFLSFVFVNALWVVPRLVREEEWLEPTAAFVRLAVQVFTGFSVAGVLALLLWWRGARLWASAPVLATFFATVPLFCEGLVLMAPNNSSFSLALRIERYIQPLKATVVYQAPEEYQTCAGLNYYLRQRIEILPPRHYVLPTYLEPHAANLFIDPETLVRWWRERNVIWISDPLRPDQDWDAVLPGPYEVIARDASRVAVRNVRPRPVGDIGR
ncbi:MAG: hypothetical protein KatS3mg077_1493 [Candidatus Binatia bacterium]|nr:MAG: hypothetical protein KatS3mg015_2570 [Fimbriimonadales bacterium]GIW44211.1 MAG: hypothetical protein KatS3mg077_1493 [Candidatus Binatia bacterium]